MTINIINFMNTTDKVLKYLKGKKTASGKEIADFLGISRQAVNKHLKALIGNGEIVKKGITKGALYKIAGKTRPEKRLGKSYILKGLEEDRIFNELELFLNLKKYLRENVLDIVRYAFTELLNNAIEHSYSKIGDIEAIVDQYRYFFRIRDYGIGIFSSIHKKFDLPDENAAIGELLKGKTTTMRERHTGEGIFFTSKSGDTITFRSHKINLIFDNIKQDIFVEKKRFIKGTEVTFSISRSSKKALEEVFRIYAPEDFDYKFEKTYVYVKLFQNEYISRSEARRLLSGLDKFKEIILDFKGVKSLGQGFADEVFRVFKNQNPNIAIKTENLSPVIGSMIKHVIDNKI
ncbi:MAG: STAS-like domain-containing protein [Candidatus Hodarchaeota archaeon]